MNTVIKVLMILGLAITVKPRVLRVFVRNGDDDVDLEKRGWFEEHGIFKRHYKPTWPTLEPRLPLYKRSFWNGVQTVFGGFKPDENFYKYMDAPRYSRY